MLTFFSGVSQRVLIFKVIFTGIFATVALVVINSFLHSLLTDKHMRKNYFQQWKLTRGTIKERKLVDLPKDSYFAAVSAQMNKINNWIVAVCIVAIVILIAAILVLGIGKS